MTLQLIGLRDRLPRITLDFKHPAVRRILRLYAPVAGGLVVSALVVVLDTRLASLTGDASLAAMRYATNVVQLPLGLVATALSFAILPVLSRYGSAADPGFKRTLGLGIKAALLLIVPATVILVVLREPVIRIIFQRGTFDADDVQLTSQALLFYAPQLPFVAVDQLLIAAFYALRNTKLPVLVGVVGALVYAAVAFLTLDSLGMAGLVLANSVQNSLHAVVLFIFLIRMHGASPSGVYASIARVGAAGAVMALMFIGIQALVPAPAGALALALHFVVSVGLGGAAYLGLLAALRGEELVFARTLVLDRLRGRRSAPAEVL